MNNGLFQQNVSNDFVRSLPIKAFQGQILLIDNPSTFKEVEKVIDGESILGFDTETRPSFKKGRLHKMALIQLSTRNIAILIRMNKVHIPKFIIDVLESKDIVKVGVALKDDLVGLKKVVSVQPENFLDLQKYVKQYGIEDNGLKKLVANVLGFRISKKCQTSNWEQDTLTHDQLVYAATDAWVCREIYERLVDAGY